MNKAVLQPFLPHSHDLVELLQYRAALAPERTAFICLRNGQLLQRAQLSYGDLALRAKAIAAYLQLHYRRGDRILLLYPSGLDFIAAFFGCLFAGMIPVPALPARRHQALDSLEAIASNAQTAIALTTSMLCTELRRRFDESAQLKHVSLQSTDAIEHTWAADWREHPIASDAIAMLQYTSGSTGRPKGVMVSHANMLHNQRIITNAYGCDEERTIVSWLPMFHDMGLIGGVLHPLYIGRPGVLFAPEAFLQKPFRWLEVISHYRAVSSGGPNFAYELCLERVTPQQRSTLDLSGWNIAVTGAEPISAETLRNFAAGFASCGFRKEAFCPSYGMAEATLFVSGVTMSSSAKIRTVDADALARGRIRRPDAKAPKRDIVGCGSSDPSQHIAIVDPDTSRRCESDEVGEIWVRGASVACGYWRQPEVTRETFGALLRDTGQGPFLRTGDLGFMREGELFIVGRLKDVIIIRGRNHFPEDIESTVQQSHPAVACQIGAAFSVASTGAERLIVAQEVNRRNARKLDVPLAVRAIRQRVFEQHGLDLQDVLLLKPGSIPRTSSGKVRRFACKKMFLQNDFTSNARSQAMPSHLGQRFSQSGQIVGHPEPVSRCPHPSNIKEGDYE